MPNVPSEVYPFSTQDGQAIPLDILKPAAFIPVAVALAPVAVVLPATSKVAMFTATEDCLVVFGALAPSGALASGTAVSSGLYVPKGMMVSSTVLDLDLSIRTISESAAVLFIQTIEKWAGLALDRQYQRK